MICVEYSTFGAYHLFFSALSRLLIGDGGMIFLIIMWMGRIIKTNFNPNNNNNNNNISSQ